MGNQLEQVNVAVKLTVEEITKKTVDSEKGREEAENLKKERGRRREK